MSVLIRGMEMPQGCIYESNDGTTKYCPMCDNNDVPYCKWLEDDDAAIGIDERPCYCPLVEVKEPHGRLIDADELANKTFYSKTRAPYITYKTFVDAPTIIEAEGSK